MVEELFRVLNSNVRNSCSQCLDICLRFFNDIFGVLRSVVHDCLGRFLTLEELLDSSLIHRRTPC